MTGLRLEFIAIDSLGNPLSENTIGPLDDAPGVPRENDLVTLGGWQWTVSEVRWRIPTDGYSPMTAVLYVR